jgi:aminomethyltransferase
MSTQTDGLRTTALTTWHLAAGAKMGDFAGWSMPLEYPSGTVTEHRAVRSGCGIFDVSHMGTLMVAGSDAIGRLNDVLTNDLRRLEPGQAQYTLLCNDAGGVVDDMIVTLLSAEQAVIVPNAANTSAVLGVLRAEVGEESVVDQSAGTAILAVQGPRSRDVLAQLGLPVDTDYMSARIGQIEGVDVVVSRSGYTGEHGYELLAPNDVAVAIWEDIQGVPIVTPCGLGARDTLRTEMGYPLHGQDISPTIDPITAGLSWAIGWDKPAFAGREALLSVRQAGPAQRLRGVRLLGRGIPRPGMTVEKDDHPAGRLTSGTFSPTLKQGIGLGLVDAAVGLDEQVAVDVRGRPVPAVVVRPPFVDSSPK